MRKALIVGINHYDRMGALYGCVQDAHAVKAALERHGDGAINFPSPRLLSATGPMDVVRRAQLKDAVQDLFASDCEIALFYFAGHGSFDASGGYILSSEDERGDGVPLNFIMRCVNESKAKHKVVLLDSCHSGAIAGASSLADNSFLAEGVSILTASTADQYASEKNSSGVFTGLLVDALQGAACNLLGQISPGSVYAHIDQSLGPWAQRPIFKANVRQFISLRTVPAPIEQASLQRLAEFFPEPAFEFKLDPTFESNMEGRPCGVPPPNPANVSKFRVLQSFNRVNLLVPVDAPHMWHAAMQSKSCRLTALGEHYRRLVTALLI